MCCVSVLYVCAVLVCGVLCGSVCSALECVFCVGVCVLCWSVLGSDVNVSMCCRCECVNVSMCCICECVSAQMRKYENVYG